MTRPLQGLLPQQSTSQEISVPSSSQLPMARVKKWAEFQHYKDRSPPWLKLHRGLLDDYDFQRLPIASKALAPMLWLIAAEDKDGLVCVDVDYLAFRLRWPTHDISSGVSSLISKGFLIVASGVLAERYQDATPETETEVEKEKATVQSAAPLAQGVPDSLPADIPKPAAPAEPPAPEKQKRKPKPQATADRFAEWWAAYPVKKGKADALRHWKTHALDPMADALIAHVRRMEREDDEWRRGFIPHGSTYICGKRWEDDPKKDKPATAVTASSPENFGAKAALAPSESKLEHAISWAKQQYQRGDFGDVGTETALAALVAAVDEAKVKHGGVGGQAGR